MSSFRKRGRDNDRGGNDNRQKMGGGGGGDRGRGGRGRGGGGRGRGGGGGDRGFHSSRRQLSQEEIRELIEESKLNFNSLTSFPETKETDVGILCYRIASPGFSGILKQRYSDFLVNEITPENEVLRLTPSEVIEPPTVMSDDSGEERLRQIVGEERTQNFLTWYKRGCEEKDARILAKKKRQSDFRAGVTPTPNPNTAAAQTEPFVFDVDLEKQARTDLHTTLREYPGISTDTIEGGKKAGSGDTAAPRSVRALFGDSQHFAGAKFTWPAKWPNFVKFVLYKENIETMGAITQICNMMHVNPKNFAFAGTKDKRAVTVQHVSGFKIVPERLLQVCRAIPNISIGRITFAKTGLKLGELNGNRFTIVLRDCLLHSSTASASTSASSLSSNVLSTQSCEDAMESALLELKKTGFINYFGLQRFGTSAPTNLIGKLLLQEKFDVAFAHLMLPPSHGEREDVTAARKYFISTRDVQGTFDRLPPWVYVERCLLQGLLINGPNSFINAFQKLPRTTRSMYGHAYQSHVWNAMTSLRLTLLDPLRVVEGDLVLPQNKDVDCLLEEEGVGMVDEDESVAPASWSLPEPILVTKQEAEEGKYSIYDVVLPLPGHSVQYPSHILREKYREFLAADNLDEKSFTTSKLSELKLAGGYRKILALPKDLEWSIHHYSYAEDQVVPTDRDLLKNEAPAETKGDKVALCVKFSLPPASYATMCVRELVKASTSSLSMTALNFASRETESVQDEEEIGEEEEVEDTPDARVHL